MLGHLAMHSGNRIRTVEILCEAKNICIADVAIRPDQLPTEQIELRTSKVAPSHLTSTSCAVTVTVLPSDFNLLLDHFISLITGQPTILRFTAIPPVTDFLCLSKSCLH